MKNDDLEKLEASEEVKRLIRSSRKQYEEEKQEHAPMPFSSVMDVIRKNRINHTKRGISSWWLAAACLLGCIIGYAFPGKAGSAASDKLVVADTVIVYRQQTDTIYREVIVQQKIMVAAGKTVSKPAPICETSAETKPDFLSPELLQQKRNLPDPDSEYYVANGMTAAEDNYPLHLLISVPYK